MRSISARSLVLALLSAILQVFSFPTSGQISPWRAAVCWISLIPFLVALMQKGRAARPLSIRGGAVVGYLCGVLWYLGNCSWIYQTMYLYGGMAKPVAFLILILFSLYLGLYHALFGALIVAFRRSPLGINGALLLSPFAWVAVELMRSRVTGFPWDLLGNALVDNRIVTHLAPLGGVLAISFLVASMNAAIASIWVADGSWRHTLAAGSFVFVLVLQVFGMGGERTLRNADQLAVMVQENISVGASARGTRALSVDEEMQRFSALSMNPVGLVNTPGRLRPTVVIWPEAPSNLRSDDLTIRSELGKLALAMDTPVIAGSLGVDLDPKPARGYYLFDSAMLFARSGEYEGRYDKIHLVPWGEYVPYKAFFSFAQKLTEGSSDMDPGQRRSVFKTGGHSYGVFICYESIFGDEVRQFVNNGADVLVNISDDGWYGNTGAPWQHLNMARMRAIENHRWVLRSTNTGETTVIDPDGDYTATPRHVRTAYALPFRFESVETFYTRHGDWFAYLCGAVTLAAVCACFVRGTSQAGEPSA